jgi:peptidoglycan hydrolase-like protein with peptidoglycan-binding domain
MSAHKLPLLVLALALLGGCAPPPPLVLRPPATATLPASASAAAAPRLTATATPTPLAAARSAAPAGPATATVTPTLALPTGPTPTPRTLRVVSPPLSGEDVWEVQQRLLRLGYVEVGRADGVYSKLTAQAVRHFQRLNRLPINGTVGPLTREVLFSEAAVPAPTPTAGPTASPVSLAGFSVGGSVSLDLAPDLLVRGGGLLWAADTHLNQVQSVYPPTGHVSAAIPLAGEPKTLAWDGRRLWVKLGDNRLQSIEVGARAASEPLDLGVCPGCPPSSALGFDGIHMWTGGGDDRVYAFSPATGHVITSTRVGNLPFGPMLFDGHCMWVNVGDGNIAAWFQPTAHRCRLAVAPPPAGALAFDGARLWSAAAGSGTAVAVDLAAPGSDYAHIVAVGAGSHALAWDGRRLWVSNTGDGTLVAVDVLNGKAGPPLAVPGIGGLAFDGHRLWAANPGSHTLQWLAGSP